MAVEDDVKELLSKVDDLKAKTLKEADNAWQAIYESPLALSIISVGIVGGFFLGKAFG